MDNKKNKSVVLLFSIAITHFYCLPIKAQVKSMMMGIDFSCSPQIEFVNANGEAIDFSRIGHWGEDNGTGGLTGYGSNNVYLNGATQSDNFVDLDLDKFFIKITDPSANLSSTTAEQIQVEISTSIDQPHLILLFETGPNTGVFLSFANLLVTNNLSHPIFTEKPDDKEKIHDGITGIVADEALNDRTHEADLNSLLQAKYQDYTAEIPVCNRNPDERKRVKLNVHVFVEPMNEDYNMDGIQGGTFWYNVPNDLAQIKTKIDDLILTSTTIWAQACISVEKINQTIEIAPFVNGTNIFADNLLDDPYDLVTIANTYISSANNDVIEVFVTPSGGGGFSGLTLNNSTATSMNGNTFVFVTAFGGDEMTLAHELGHALADIGDPDVLEGELDNPDYIIFPKDNAFPVPYGTVNSIRRITKGTEELARNTAIQLLHQY